MIELPELLQATGGRLAGPAAAQRFSAFAYDSRLLPVPPADPTRPGPLFVAVKTEKGDGHDYILDAVARGAAGVLCQELPPSPAPHVTWVVVPDTRAALVDYARHALRRHELTTVAITGSTGKTTAKELTAAVLSRAPGLGPGTVFRNRGSINGRYGLSIAAGELEARHRLAVFELAADSFDEIRDLADLTHPRVGALTAIQEVHLATFGSLAAIAEEKGRLLEALPADGLAVLNADDPLVMAQRSRTRAAVVAVGSSLEADLRAEAIELSTDGVAFTAKAAGPAAGLRIRSRLLGRHHVPLLLTAVAVGRWFGVPDAEIADALAAFEPLPGHLRLLAGRHGSLLLDDTVNASPAAMLAALEVLALFRDRPRIAVLGDMWELGHREISAHRQVGERAATVVDYLVVKGERAQEIANGAQEAGLPRSRILRAYTDADAVRLVEGLLTRSAGAEPPVVLVKGDRPARLERIVAGLLAEPQRAAELLERQTPGWLQVRPLTQDRPTWLEIDLEAVAGNVRRAQEIVGPEVAICAVLKADGYGHGAVSVARTALNNGARMLAVACLAEAVVLRRAAVDAPILVLGYTPPWQARDTLRHDVAATVYDLDVARALSRAAADLNRPARVHVKVDTGMGRLGLLPDQVVPFVQALAGLPGVVVEGIFTHFSVADSLEPEHIAHTRMQLAVFRALLDRLQALGLRPPLVHAANSAAALTLPESRFDMVRLGIALYGLAPSPAVPLPEGFRPVLSWKTQVAQVKDLPPGATVSYGNTYRTQRPTRLAVIPVGYADGFRRAPQHWGHVLVRGRPAPIIGRVTMDQTMIDVTDIPGVRQGDEVVLIGRQGTAEITAEQVAERLGTIAYEVVAQILARVPRVV
ncbi:MAG: alanine racemase [Caldilineales bacterium]|nr:alanine racemase [Caldilineales bacterium]MDW8316806.1 alanine racemase [Anaerolineae bacterium]